MLLVHRGPPLGRPLDARVPRLPGRAACARERVLVVAHLPLRRAAPPPPAARRCWPSSSARRARAGSSSRRSRRDGAGRAARRTSSARRPPPTSSTGCGRAARATRCSPRSCWRPGSTGAAACRDTLRDALMVRVERLPEPAQEVLRLARRRPAARPRAARGDAAGWSRATLREALREAVDAHILVVDDEGRYAFRHALLREVVDDDLLPGERAELHLRARARARARASPTAPRGAVAADRPPLRRRGRPARRARRRACAPATAADACTPTARRPRCSSARSSCGTACRTPRSWPASTA